jgi:predicted nucleotidyltransferase
MPIPEFNETGDLPVGVHRATLAEVIERFGQTSPQRQEVTERLLKVFALAKSTGNVSRFIIYGSYITDKSEPNDVDIFLIMQDDFESDKCVGEQRQLFVHYQADVMFGASIFWIRPAHILLTTMEEFINHWQVKRDQTRRGIIEVEI